MKRAVATVALVAVLASCSQGFTDGDPSGIKLDSSVSNQIRWVSTTDPATGTEYRCLMWVGGMGRAAMWCDEVTS